MNSKMWMSVGAAMAARKIGKAVSNIEMNDVLAPIGLERRRSHLLENFGLVAAGALVGAGAAVLFAPRSGRDTRERLSSEASRIGHAAADKLQQQKEQTTRSLHELANGVSAASR